MSMLLQLTTAGQAIVEAALAPVVVTSYKLGASFGYVPPVSQTDIVGALRHTGTPSAPIVEDGNSIRYSVNLPAALGPFSYGEVGLFVGATLFAIGVFETEMTKLPANQELDTGGNVVIDMHLPTTDPNYQMWSDVAQANTFKLNVVGGPHLIPRAEGANPNLLMVRPPNSNYAGFMAYTDRLGLWQYENYQRLGTLTVVAATTSSVTCARTESNTLLGDDRTIPEGDILIQFASGINKGLSRYCTGKTLAAALTQLNLGVPLAAAPLTGTNFHVYSADLTLVDATPSTRGVVRLTTSAGVPSVSDTTAATPGFVAALAGGSEHVDDAFGS